MLDSIRQLSALLHAAIPDVNEKAQLRVSIQTITIKTPSSDNNYKTKVFQSNAAVVAILSHRRLQGQSRQNRKSRQSKTFRPVTTKTPQLQVKASTTSASKSLCSCTLHEEYGLNEI